MPRIVWLAYEKLPHPDAVSHPANEDDVHTVLELLDRPRAERLRIAEQLRKFVKHQKTQPLFCREMIPCRRHSGRYHPIPWRLAKWLSHVLPIQTVHVVSAKPTCRGPWDRTQLYFAQPTLH